MRGYRGSPRVVSAARAVAVLLGVAIFATGVAAVFETENGTGAAALLGIGAALVVVAVLGERIKSVELYGVSLTIKDMARETFALARQAERRGEVEAAEQLRAVGSELRDLASEYRRLREFRRSGVRRTAALEEVIAKARRVPERQALEPTEVSRWFEEGTPEARIVALGLMQGDPELRDFDAGIDAIEHSRSAFEQFHGLLLCGVMLSPSIAKGQGTEPGPKLRPGECDQLESVVEKAMRGRHMRHSIHRTRLGQSILDALKVG